MCVGEQSLPLVITCGDPSGVGPELVEQLLAMDSTLVDQVVVVGPRKWVGRLSGEFGVLSRPVGPEGFEAECGRPCETGARVALEAMEVASAGCRDGFFRGVVTGPVSKFQLAKVGFCFPGQTEFFADAWGGDPTMAFVGEKLRVVLATWHIPLSEVPMSLDAAALTMAVERARILGTLLGIDDPRIGVCGLNPHAGEDGVLGREEMEILDPALDILRASIPGLTKCLPGDTVFFRQLNGEFDVVVAAYHDQGLAAVKTLEFDRAVNVTLGLPYLRTSPDHGTAFDIAGRGKADVSSFAAAVRVLSQLTA